MPNQDIPHISSFYVNTKEGALSVEVDSLPVGISDLLFYMDMYLDSQDLKDSYEKCLGMLRVSFVEIVSAYRDACWKYPAGTSSSDVPLGNTVTFVDPELMISFYHDNAKFDFRASSPRAFMQGVALFIFCMHYWNTDISILRAEYALALVEDVLHKYKEMYIDLLSVIE